MLIRSAALLLASLNAVAALDVRFQKNSMICDNRLVKLSLNHLCNDDDLCTLGDTVGVEGSCKSLLGCDPIGMPALAIFLD